MKRLEREVLALITLRQMFEFEPPTLEDIATLLRSTPGEIRHVVWGLWMDDKIKAWKARPRRWILS